MTWYAGFFDGGTDIIDYTIAYGKASGSYSEKIEHILTTSYTVEDLENGATYKFKVLARNKYGDSVYSAEVTELAAQIPDRPFAPTTRIKDTN